MPSGSLLVDCISKQQSEKILATNKLRDFDITTELHRQLNTSRGVITCYDLLNSSEEEILEGLKDRGGIGIRRINRKAGAEKIPTGSIILTFNRPQIPERIKTALYPLKVRPYIPSPRGCIKCLHSGSM